MAKKVLNYGSLQQFKKAIQVFLDNQPNAKSIEFRFPRGFINDLLFELNELDKRC